MKAVYDAGNPLFVDGVFVQIRLPGLSPGAMVFVERLSVINSAVKAVFNADLYLRAMIGHKAGEASVNIHVDGQVNVVPASLGIFSDNTGVSYFASRYDSEVGEVLPADWLFLALEGLAEAGLGVGEVVVEYRPATTSDLVAAQVAVAAM